MVYIMSMHMICFDYSTKPLGTQRFCAFMGRRDGVSYKMDHDAIMAKYGHCMKMQGRVPDALSGAMANIMYVANFDTAEECDEYYRELMERN